MSSGGGMAMRTVWITLRAVNYTEQAFRNTVRDVDKLSEAEKKEREGMLRTIDTARLRMQQNALYLAMLSMLSTKLWSFLQLTSKGAEYMSEFNQTIKDLKTSFADALFDALKPALDVLQSLMKWFTSLDPNIKKVVAIVGLLAMGIAGLAMTYSMLNNYLLMNTTMTALNKFMTDAGTVSNVKNASSIWGLVIAHKALAISLGVVFAAFGIFFTILTGLSGPVRTAVSVIMTLVGAILALVTAKSWLTGTFGIEGIAGLIGVGAVLAGASSLAGQATGSFAKGTSALPSTGLFLGHKGEIVYNPQTNRPAGMQSEVMGEGGSRTTNTMTVNFNGNIHTKADIEDLDDVVGKRIYRAIKGAT